MIVISSVDSIKENINKIQNGLQNNSGETIKQYWERYSKDLLTTMLDKHKKEGEWFNYNKNNLLPEVLNL